MKRGNKIYGVILFVMMSLVSAFAGTRTGVPYVSQTSGEGYFVIREANTQARLLMNTDDHIGVRLAVENLQNDLLQLTGVKPSLSFDRIPDSKSVILAGTLGKSALIDD